MYVGTVYYVTSLWLCGTRYNGFHVNETRARPSVHICWYPACSDKYKHRASIEDNVSVELAYFLLVFHFKEFVFSYSISGVFRTTKPNGERTL